jgi:hypothetical protein
MILIISIWAGSITFLFVLLLFILHSIIKELDIVIKMLKNLTRKEVIEMATLDEIITAVTEQDTQIDSLATLTAGIKKQLDDILAGALTPDQQAKVDAIFAGLQANTQEVVAAINANTTPA